MLDRIVAAIQDAASYIWSLPPVVRYPLIALLAVIIPGLSIVLIGVSGSVTVALSPVIIVYGIVWYLAKRGQ